MGVQQEPSETNLSHACYYLPMKGSLSCRSNGALVSSFIEIMLFVFLSRKVLASSCSVKRFQLAFCEDELEKEPVGNHQHHEEGEGKSGRGRLHNPKENQTEELEDSEHAHPPGGHPLHIRDVGMVLHGLNEEGQPVEELNSVHASNSHIEEDSEEDSEGDELEDGGHQHGETKEDGDHGSRNSLVTDSYHLRCLARNISRGHNCESRHMRDCPHGGRANPGTSKDATDKVDEGEEHDIKVKTCSL